MPSTPSAAWSESRWLYPASLVTALPGLEAENVLPLPEATQPLRAGEQVFNHRSHVALLIGTQPYEHGVLLRFFVTEAPTDGNPPKLQNIQGDAWQCQDVEREVSP